MNKLYVYREFCAYHVGFYDGHICIATNLDEASNIIINKLNSKYIDYNKGLNEIKNNMKEFDLSIGYKNTNN